jgi:hypothetical protein
MDDLFTVAGDDSLRMPAAVFIFNMKDSVLLLGLKKMMERMSL